MVTSLAKILGLKCQMCRVWANLRRDHFSKNCILLHQYLDIFRCRNPASINNCGNARSTVTNWQHLVIPDHILFVQTQLHLKTTLFYFKKIHYLLADECMLSITSLGDRSNLTSDTKNIIKIIYLKLNFFYKLLKFMASCSIDMRAWETQQKINCWVPLFVCTWLYISNSVILVAPIIWLPLRGPLYKCI